MKNVDQKVIDVIRDKMGFSSERKIDPADRLVRDLSVTQLDFYEIYEALEEEFEIEMSDEECETIITVQDAIDMVKKIDAGRVKPIDLLRDSAFSALRTAEKRMHAYACELDVGPERTKAFEIFENIRNASRVGLI